MAEILITPPSSRSQNPDKSAAFGCPRISAACHHVIFFAMARKIASCTFIARSTAAFRENGVRSDRNTGPGRVPAPAPPPPPAPVSATACPAAGRTTRRSQAPHGARASVTSTDRSDPVKEHALHGLLPSPPAKRTDHVLSQPDISCANDTSFSRPCAAFEWRI